jgi:hypothetical protein
MQAAAGVSSGERVPATTGARVRGALGVAALVLLLHALLLLRSPVVLQGELPDPDDAMRLVRVTALLQGDGWYSDLVPRGNAPYGETLHWTRPQDALIAVLALPLRLVLGLGSAVHLAGVIVSPLLHLLAVLLAGWVARPLARRPLGALAALTLLAQPLIVGFAAPGRADHHMLQLLVLLLGTGCLLRAAVDASDRRMARAAGLLAAFGVWVSVELLLLSLFALGVLALLWMLDGGARGFAARAFCGAHALGLAVALALERPPSGWTAVETDRLSGAHVFAAVVALLVSALLAAPAAQRRLAGRARRAGAGLLLGALGLLLLRLVLPALFQGPMSDAEGIMWARWLDWIEEYQPLLVPRDLAGLGMFLKCLGPVLICLPFALHRLRRTHGRGVWCAWAAVVFGFAVFVPLALTMIRFAPYGEILIALVLAVAAEELAEGFERMHPRTLRLIVRPLAITALIPGFLFLGAAIEAAARVDAATPVVGVDADTSLAVDGNAGRTLGGMAALLSDPDQLGDRARTVLAFAQYGPDLLYRTPHRAVASPYHRNAHGLLDAHTVFTAAVDSAALEVIRRRRVDLLLLCPVGPERLVHGVEDGDGSLYDRLLRGELPPWLRRVTLSDSLSASFRLYAVLPEPAGS